MTYTEFLKGNVRAIRQLLKLNQADFGAAIGLSRPPLIAIEVGDAPLRPATAAALFAFSVYSAKTLFEHDVLLTLFDLEKLDLYDFMDRLYGK